MDRPSQDAAKSLGAALRQWREERGWSLRQFAQRLGYATHSELSAYERGERVLPASRVEAVASLLRVDPALVGYLQRTAADERGGRRGAARPPVIVGSARPRPPRFVGRQALLARLDEVTVPLVSLAGPSGIGVREVAAEFVARKGTEFAHVEWRRGVYALTPAAVTAPQLVIVEGAAPGRPLDDLAAAVGKDGGRVLALSTDLDADVVVGPLDRDESSQMLGEAAALVNRCGGVPLALELAAGALAQTERDPTELAAGIGADPVTSLVGVAADVLGAADPIAWQLLRWLADEGTDVTTRERLVATREELPKELAAAVVDELPILDAVARLHGWALMRTSPGHLWTHARVREAVLAVS